MGDLVGIDLAVLIGVERGKEALGIRLHLVGSEVAVMVAVGLTNQRASVSSSRERARNGSPIGLMKAPAAPGDDIGRGARWQRPAASSEKSKQQRDQHGFPECRLQSSCVAR